MSSSLLLKFTSICSGLPTQRVFDLNWASLWLVLFLNQTVASTWTGCPLPILRTHHVETRSQRLQKVLASVRDARHSPGYLPDCEFERCHKWYVLSNSRSMNRFLFLSFSILVYLNKKKMGNCQRLARWKSWNIFFCTVLTSLEMAVNPHTFWQVTFWLLFLRRPVYNFLGALPRTCFLVCQKMLFSPIFYNGDSQRKINCSLGKLKRLPSCGSHFL